jgi:acyl-CoA thioester hydrolase
LERPKPEGRDAYRHFTTVATRWMDNDVYGHVNNVVFYSFFDTAVNRYLIAEGALDPERGPVIGLVVETQCHYFAPVAFPDAVHVGLRVARVGKSSVRYEVGVFRNADPLCAAKGHFVQVCVDRASRRPVPVPDAMLAALERIRA